MPSLLMNDIDAEILSAASGHTNYHGFSYGFTKLSIVWFCRRLFVVYKWATFDIVSVLLATMNILWMSSIFLAITIQCK